MAVIADFSRLKMIIIILIQGNYYYQLISISGEIYECTEYMVDGEFCKLVSKPNSLDAKKDTG